MESFNWRDYLSVLKRRKNVFAVVALSIFLFSLIFAFNYSNYSSIATVEVAQSEVTSSMTTGNGTNPQASMEAMADKHISRIRQKVLATGSLVEIITKFNLYSGQREYMPVAEIAENMRKKIDLDLVSSSLANPASAQKASVDQLSAIAFNLSFSYGDPSVAQQVTNELVSRFLDEDIKIRRTQAQETSAFLAAQLKVLEESLTEQEKKIADFRSENGDVRPEAFGFNQQTSATLRMSLQTIEGQITANEGLQGTLRGQLAIIDPYSRIIADGQVLTTPSFQLKALKSEYATLTAKYGPQHPDVIKINKQIRALESQTGKKNETGSLQAKIIDIRTKLDTELKTQGSENPERISLENQLNSLEKQLEEAKKKSGIDPLIKNDADNPAYLQVLAQLSAAEEQHKSLEGQRDALSKQLEKFQNAVAQNPEAEKKMSALARDYDSAQLRYREMKEKKMVADMSATIEQDRSGQRLVVIDPPELPLRTSPARILFILAGFILSIMAGLGVILGEQLLLHNIVGPRHLEALAGVAPLVSIPYLVTENEMKKWDRKKIRIIRGGIFAGIIILIFFSIFVMPLDVLWAVIARRLLGLY